MLTDRRYAIGLTPTGNAEPEKQPPRASVAVVSHNRADRLRKCLESLEQSEGRERLQLIVVENGSRDGSAQVVEEFPNVQLIRLPKNFGLTKGMNLGWRAADAEYVLFLHEDTEVEPAAVARLADVLDADARRRRFARCWWMPRATRRRSLAPCRRTANGMRPNRPRAGRRRVSARRGLNGTGVSD